MKLGVIWYDWPHYSYKEFGNLNFHNNNKLTKLMNSDYEFQKGDAESSNTELT